MRNRVVGESNQILIFGPSLIEVEIFQRFLPLIEAYLTIKS